MKRGLVGLLLLVGALAIAGCDTSNMGNAAQNAFAETNARKACANFSARYIREAYGTEANCQKTVGAKAKVLKAQDVMPDVHIEKPHVDGNVGTIVVINDVAGFQTKGHVRLVKVDGKWLLDERERDLLISELDLSFDEEGLGALSPALTKESVQACFHRRWDRLDDEELREYVYGLDADRPAASRANIEEVNACIPKTKDGISGTRQLFESGLRAAGEGSGIDFKIVDCAIDRSRQLSDKRIGELSVAADDSAVAHEIEQLFTDIFESCSAGVT